MKTPKKPGRRKTAAAPAAAPATAAPVLMAQPSLVRQRTKVGIKGFYIAGLSLFCVSVVVCMLTAHLFQHAVRTTGQNTPSITLWRLIDARGQWQLAKNQKADENAKYLSLLTQQSLATKELERLQSEKTAAELKTIAVAAVLNKKLLDTGAPVERVDLIVTGAVVQRAKRYQELVAEVAPNDADLASKFASYKEALNEELQLVKSVDVQAKSVRQQKEQLTAAKSSVDQLSNNLGAFLDRIDVDEKDQVAFGDYLNQLNSLDGLYFTGLSGLATMEPDLLTLLLVLAMGMLGGTLHLAKLFIEDDPNVSASYYFYRPFLGAIMALVMFVVVRSGLFVIAESGQASGGTMLSPFFISFMAIVSGLLAEKAIATIQDRGVKWFATSSQEDVRRYAVHVKAEAEKQNKTREALAATGFLSEDDIKALFDGKSAVSMDVQRLVSFALGKPIRELFSDIAPAA